MNSVVVFKAVQSSWFLSGPERSRFITWVKGSNPAGTSLNPAAVQFFLGRWSLSRSLWHPATAVTTVMWERSRRMKSCIVTLLDDLSLRGETKVGRECLLWMYAVWLTAAEAGSVIDEELSCWSADIWTRCCTSVICSFLLPSDTNVDDDIQKLTVAGDDLIWPSGQP